MDKTNSLLGRTEVKQILKEEKVEEPQVEEPTKQETKEMAEEQKQPEVDLAELQKQIAELQAFKDSVEIIEDEPQQEVAETTKETPEQPKSDEELDTLKKQLEETTAQLSSLKDTVENAKSASFEHNPEDGVDKGNDFLLKLNDPNFRRQASPMDKFWAHAQAMGIKDPVDPTK